MKTQMTNHWNSLDEIYYIKSKVQYIKGMDRTSLMFKAFNSVNRSEMARMSTLKFAPRVSKQWLIE